MMPPDEVRRALEQALNALRPLNVPVALLGGLAMGAWKRPRFTKDVDLLIAFGEPRAREAVNALTAAGFRCERPKSVIHVAENRFIQLHYDPPGSMLSVRLDLLLATTPFHEQALARRVALPESEMGFEVFVVSCEDLIVFKLIAGRVLDLLLVSFGIAVGCAYGLIVWTVSEYSIVGLTCAIVLAGTVPLLAWQLSRMAEPGQTTAQRLSMIVLSPVVMLSMVLVLVAMLPVMLFAIPVASLFALQHMRKNGRLMRHLAKQGRLLPMSQVAPRLEAGQGTLLEETGPKGPYRIWWTSDDLTASAPPIEDGERFVQLLEGIDVGGFNQLCLESYMVNHKAKQA